MTICELYQLTRMGLFASCAGAGRTSLLSHHQREHKFKINIVDAWKYLENFTFMS